MGAPPVSSWDEGDDRASEPPSPLRWSQILPRVAPFAVACLAVIATGWGGNHPLAGAIVLATSGLVTLVLFLTLDPEGRAERKADPPDPLGFPSLHRCEQCGSKAVERRVDHRSNPPMTAITCLDCDSKARRPYLGMVHCERCGSDRTRVRSGRVRCPRFVLLRCRACGTTRETWSEYAEDRCQQCGSGDLQKKYRPRFLATYSLTCRDCKHVTNRHER